MLVIQLNNAIYYKENLDRVPFFSTEFKTYKFLKVLYIRIFREKNSKRIGNF